MLHRSTKKLSLLMLLLLVVTMHLHHVLAWQPHPMTSKPFVLSNTRSKSSSRLAVVVDQVDLQAVATTPAVSNKPRKGSNPEFIIEGDSIQDTLFQKAIVATHFALMTTNIIAGCHSLGDLSVEHVLGVVLAFVSSVVLGDLGTGIFHWSVDNYGSINTPIFGNICVAFQGHHKSPWTITFRPFANNVHKIAIATVPFMLALLATTPVINPYLQVFFAFFINWWLMSQELHKYSHMKQVPSWMKFLQDNNLVLSRKEHGLHHLSPFEGHYCIVNGMCNSMLDNSDFYRHLEKAVYRLTGNEPITWKEDPAMKERAMSSKIIP